MPAPLRFLFLDLNAFFASVEQQVRPELRGRPIVVAPVMTDSTCCIAASYEAKRFGIRTGTNIGEARRMCPDLQIVEARHEEYIKFHHRIVDVVDSCIPVEAVHSIDEMCCRFMSNERSPEKAVEIAGRIKRTIHDRVGPCLRSSIGIATNRFLAKVGTDMQKPDGLVLIHAHELPHRLHGLQLMDLPGIGPRMHRRLRFCGVGTVQELCALGEDELVRIWRGVLGRYWFRWLRGEEAAERATHRRSIGHQHVLPPALRNDHDARAVAVRLLHKAAARARLLGYWANRLTLSVRHVHQPGWWKWIQLNGTQDTLEMVEAFTRLWAMRPPHTPLCVGVTLDHLTADRNITRPLFPQQRHRAQLCAAIDRLNYKYQRNLVYAGAMHEARQSAPLRIAFRSIPDPAHDL